MFSNLLHLFTKMEELLGAFVKETYVKQGLANIKARQNRIESLLRHKKLPSTGWTDSDIEHFIRELSEMDSNNFDSNVGVGEREGRIYSSIVSQRSFNLAHGIGRSGDIAEVQPKAAGSSLILKLCTVLVANALTISGLTCAVKCLVLPLATGMSITMSLLALRAQNPEANYVIWSRIDQKSCFKAITTAGLTPLIVENIFSEDELVTDIETIRRLLIEHGKKVLCVISTTSCFAPRQPDLVDQIALACKEFDVAHVVNNAYGLQCTPFICKLINRAAAIGRVDAVVQSTDKNFLVPVGGAIVFSPSAAFIDSLSAMYPGRASAAPVLDLLITLLSMGESGYRKLLNDRLELCPVLKEGLAAILQKHCEFGLRVLSAKRNSISIAVAFDSAHPRTDLTFFGSMLFSRSVSGCRVVCKSEKPSFISGSSFVNWGAHANNYPYSYFTVACAVGTTRRDIEVFLERLEKTMVKFFKPKITVPLEKPQEELVENFKEG